MIAPSTSPKSGSPDTAKQSLEARLKRKLGQPRTPGIPKREAQGEAALSFAQQRLWFLDQLDPNSPMYNLSIALRLRGGIDPSILEVALRRIVERHEILRTRYVSREGSPVQVVDSRVELILSRADLSLSTPSQREAELQKLLEEEAGRPFDLSSDPVIRTLWVNLGLNESAFLVVVHHIASDGWSMGNFFDELGKNYEELSAGRLPQLEVLPVQYADYAVWQRNRCQGDFLNRELTFWQKRLAEAPESLDLPIDHPRTPSRIKCGGSLTRYYPTSLGSALKKLSYSEGVTLYMTLLAAFKVLLHRYSGQSDILVASPIAGRTQMELEHLIGFFINTLVLRTDLAGNPQFNQYLKQVSQVALDAFDHQELPFDKLVQVLRPDRGGGMPFAQVMFVLQNGPAQQLRLGGVTVETIDIPSTTAKFDLTLAVEEHARGLRVSCEYDSSLFEPSTIEGLIEHYRILLEGIVATPSSRIGELPLLSAAAWDAIMNHWGRRVSEYPRQQTIHQLFDEQVKQTPHAPALKWGGRRMNYSELQERSNQIAHLLQRSGVGPDSLVVVSLERSFHLIVSLLGVLKAGGAYVFLDPRMPAARQVVLFDDVKPKVLLTEPQFLLQFSPGGTLHESGCLQSVNLVCLDEGWTTLASEKRVTPVSVASAENLAYVSFTSGSTGRPKGVCIPHRGVVRLVKNNDYARLHGEVFLQLAPVSFDASTFEIWGPLLNGSLLVIHPAGTPSLSELGATIVKEKITTLWLTAGLFHQMVEEQLESFTGVRQLLAGGDVISPSHVETLMQRFPSCQVINGYGPTESTTFACCHKVELPLLDRNVPIGRGIANTELYVVDAYGQLVPQGVPGELWIGGDGLARGYLGRSDLTADKFIPNPFSQEAQARVYRTGDRVAFLSDGSLRFLGRLDEQVKIRGFRVEVGEVEAVLQAEPSVREAAVIARTVARGEKALVAYVVPTEEKPTSEEVLRSVLKLKLPDYLVPAFFVFLPSLPLNRNGKVDRKLLPEPTDQGRGGRQIISPKTPLESEIVAVWQSVLQIPNVGVRDNFFELGGHSLLAVKLVSQLEKALSKKIPVATLFNAPTVEDLARVLSGGGSTLPHRSLVPLQSQGSQPPLYFIHGVGGGMFWGYANLASHLGSDHPVFALKSRGLEGLEEHGSIEEMARHYLEEIRRFQPEGPYYLSGYCFGGNVAYEMARLLEADGQEVGGLFLLNCAPPNSSYQRVRVTPRFVGRFMRNVFLWIGNFMQWEDTQRSEFLRWKLRVWRDRINGFLPRAHSEAPATGSGADRMVDLSQFPEEQRELWRRHIRSLMQFHPQPYGGKITLIRSRGHQFLCSFDDRYGWGEYAREVEMLVVPGTHESILEEPHVRATAKTLKSLLDRRAPAAEGVVAQHCPNPNHENKMSSRVDAPLPPPVESLNPSMVSVPQANPGDGVKSPAKSRHDAGYLPSVRTVEFSRDRVYIDFFSEQVLKSPNSPAVRFQGVQLTYSELNHRITQLASLLQSRGVRSGSKVAVCLERSLGLPVVLLAIFKAGAAYVPLDPAYPSERLHFMLQDSQSSVLISDEVLISRLGSSGTLPESIQLVRLADAMRELETQAREFVPVKSRPEDLAYVIYTSGTTGKPKGVMISQGALLNHNFGAIQEYALTSNDRVLQFAAYSFDISVEELFPTWLVGAELVLRDDEVLATMPAFLNFVRNEQLNVLNLPTAYWHQLVDHLESPESLGPSLRLVVIGGEQVSQERFQTWLRKTDGGIQLINSYGPTECTVTATTQVARGGKPLTIGKPLPNIFAYVVDDGMRLIPQGEVGELLLGGASLSDGYLGRPDLTATRFISSPFGEPRAPRLYRTGDLVRWNDEGELEFMGRADDQVKIRGFRIELSEIESVLDSHPGVRQSLLLLREDPGSEKRLVAYYLPTEGQAPSFGNLVEYLKARLPQYMIPSALVPLDSFPLQPNGKVDRRALPVPGAARPELNEAFLAPRTPLEGMLSTIWADVLGVDRVGINDNFFDLGGHSLLATQIISRMRETLKVDVAFATIFDAPTVAQFAHELKSAPGGDKGASNLSASKRYPLSPAEERLWVLEQLEPRTGAYNQAVYVERSLPKGLELWREGVLRSWPAWLKKHDALLSIFPVVEGRPCRIALPSDRPPALECLDLSLGVPHPLGRAAVSEARALELVSLPMSLETGPLVRAEVHLIDTDRVRLILVAHELVASRKALSEAVLSLIEESPSTQHSTLTHSHVIQRGQEETQWWKSPEAAQLLEFWKSHLKDAPLLLEVPADFPRPAVKTSLGGAKEFLLGIPNERLKTVSMSASVSPETLLLSCIHALLHRYTRQQDIVLGLEQLPSDRLSPVAEAFSPHPFRATIDPLASLLSLAQSNEQVLKSWGQARRVSFERILDEIQPTRDRSYTPIFQVVVGWISQLKGHSELAQGRLLSLPIQFCNYDLRLSFDLTGEQVRLVAAYSKDLFLEQSLDRMANHLETLVIAALDQPQQLVARLPMLGQAESQCLLETWNPTAIPPHQGLCVHELFERQVARIPLQMALVVGRSRLTYEALSARVNARAQRLLASGVKPGSLVGVCLSRSEELVVTLMAILKAGAAYVPLDPHYPADRILYMVEDAQAPYVVTESKWEKLFQKLPAGTQLYRLEQEAGTPEPTEVRFPKTTPDQLAYVIYTSGSTGKPKGVALEHRSAVAFAAWAETAFDAEEFGGMLASTSICFDLSIFEIFVTLACGGKIILAENALQLPSLPAVNEVRLINSVPSAMAELLRLKAVPGSVITVNLAGEPLATRLVDQIYATGTVKRVVDLYGPTETTVYSTWTVRQAGAPATIGKPLTYEQVYLLDPHGELCPINIPGELHIGGAGLARGYLHKPELTSEKFIPNPFSRLPGARMYRTGDLARFRPDGNIEYLGRIDNQVKIRGFRIELGEIESVLRKHSGVQDVAVIAREDRPGDKRLVAYIVGKQAPAPSAAVLREHLKVAVPEYMVPGIFVGLKELPLTPNGKVNRKGLPAPEAVLETSAPAATFEPPRTPLEELVAASWIEVLGRQRVGATDDFFDLGGNSLLAIQVITRLRDSFQAELPLSALFEAPTVRALAEAIEGRRWGGGGSAAPTLAPILGVEDYPLSFAQRRLWIIDQMEPGNCAYNMPTALEMIGQINVQALERALGDLVERHGSFRTAFFQRDGEPRQRLVSGVRPRLSVVDFPSGGKNLDTLIRQEARRPFDLEEAPLVRFTLFRRGAEDHVLLVVMHHIISDGWSMGVFFQELDKAYRAKIQSTAPHLPLLPVQYVDFSQWQQSAVQTEAMNRDLEFWKGQLKGAPSSTSLPVDRLKIDADASQGGAVERVIPASMAQEISHLAKQTGITPFMLLLGSLMVVLQRWTGQSDLVVGTVVAGRNRRELENLVGCFMNFLPIRASLSNGESLGEFRQRLKAGVLEVFAHQECPFDKIVEAVNPERSANQNPIYNVGFLLQNFPGGILSTENLKTRFIPAETDASLLDLRMVADESEQGLLIRCEYRADRFEAETLERFIDDYLGCVALMVKEPGTKVGAVPLSDILMRRAAQSRHAFREQQFVISSTFTAEPTEDAFRYWMEELEVPARVAFAGYNQILQELVDPSSQTRRNVCGANIILVRLEDWSSTHAAETDEGQEGDARDPDKLDTDRVRKQIREFVSALQAAVAQSTTPYVVVSCPASSRRLAVNGQSALLLTLEGELAQAIEPCDTVHWIGSSQLTDLCSLADYDDPAGDRLGHVPYTPLFFSALGTHLARRIHALRRAPHKVIVLDCDNTLWCGVCGEEGAAGIRPLREVQEFFKAQQEAGMLLAVCSKNNEQDLNEVFSTRTDMPLQSQHITAWKVNWLPKSENIRALARELNLGLDSFIFVDDNPMECAEVESRCPEVMTLALPESEEAIPAFLKRCWVFDRFRVTAEDRQRTQLYQSNRERARFETEAGSLHDFVAGLELQIEMGPVKADQISRVAQLTQRTNQFNTTTRRRTEGEVRSFLDLPGHSIWSVSVKDRFGDYGLVGVVFLRPVEQTLEVESLMLSCRSLGKGVEYQMLARVAAEALKRNLPEVTIPFVATAKNLPAASFLKQVSSQLGTDAKAEAFVWPSGSLAELKFVAPPGGVAELQPAAKETAVVSRPEFRKFKLCRWIALEGGEPRHVLAAVQSKRRVPRRASKSASGASAPQTEMEQKLAGFWSELLGVDRVTLSDNFFELGGHSLLAVRLFAMIEKNLGRTLRLSTLFESPTLGELALRVQDSEHHNQSALALLRPGTHGSPLFLVHGAGGGILWGYSNLSKYLPEGLPVYGLEPQAVSSSGFRTVEEMAAQYVADIRTVQPSGPYHIGGYCFGGYLAYEIARQLEADGETIAWLALIDAAAPNGSYEQIPWWRPRFAFDFGRNLWWWLIDFRRLDPKEQRAFIRRKLSALFRRFSRVFKRSRPEVEGPQEGFDIEAFIDVSHFPEHELQLWQWHLKAGSQYRPGRFEGAVTLFRTRGQPLFCSFDPTFGWGELAQSVQSITIPGSHEHIFMEPDVRSLGELMSASISCLEGFSHLDSGDRPTRSESVEALETVA